ncbi:MAG TPA: hypothetical protein VK590_03325, partial [Saprospiraceae bacterium]|nr:hypothetical protein [Saprospiraceae bacterium]
NNYILIAYDSLFFKSRIQSIDFGDSSTIKLNMFSYGKLVNVINTTYSKDQSVLSVKLNTSPSYEYLNLFLNSASAISIPYVMSFTKKMGQSNVLNNLEAQDGYIWDSYSEISKKIKKTHLSINDTLYRNKINMIYYPY